MVSESTFLVAGTVQSEMTPTPVDYYALQPPNYDERSEPLPLVLNLHGGGGNREALKNQQPNIEQLFNTGRFPPAVIVTPSVSPRSFYMDYRDGSERWESFIVGPFLEHLRSRFDVRTDKRGTLITGISMGGMGSLRLAFKHPDVFGAVAAMEPAIEPISAFKDIRPKHRFFRDDQVMSTIFGDPIDVDYWNDNNPATIIQRETEKVKRAGLKIFLEVGDEDAFWLYEGTEYLHRVLYELKIRHEYRLYHGADHVGRTVPARVDAAFEFLSRTLVDPEPDPEVEVTRQWLATLKQPLDEADHYGFDADLVTKK